MNNLKIHGKSQYLTKEELLEHLGRMIYDAQPIEPGKPLYVKKINFTHLARNWLKENFEQIRDTVCQSDYQAYLARPLSELVLYIIGLLQPIFPAGIVMALAYYLCKVGLDFLCEKSVDDFLSGQ